MEKELNNSIEKIEEKIRTLKVRAVVLDRKLNTTLSRNLSAEQLESVKDDFEEYNRISKKIETLERVLVVKYNHFTNVLNEEPQQKKFK